MFKKLDFYVLSECAPTFVLSLGVFSFVLMTHRISQLFDLVVAKGVPPLDVIKLFLLAFPTLMPILLPISLLLAVLLAMGRLSSDSEIVAMRASGVGLAQNLKPVLALSIVVTLFSALVCLWAQPAGARIFRQTLYEAVIKRINVSTEAGTFTEVGDGLTFYAKHIDQGSGRMEDLFFASNLPPLRNTVIFSPRGSVSSSAEGLVLDVEDAEIHVMGASGNELQRTRAAKSRITIPIPAPTLEDIKPDERPTDELLTRGYGIERDREARVEFQKRLSLPVSCIFLGLLGGCLGLHHSRVGKGRGFALCLGILLLYYALLTFSRTLGRRSGLNPELVMWLPNAVLCLLTVFAYVRKNRERPMPFEAALARVPVRLAQLKARLGGGA